MLYHIASILIIYTLSSCTGDGFKDEGEQERRDAKAPQESLQVSKQVQIVSRAKYLMKIKGGKVTLCDGEVELLITDDYDIQLNGPLKCLLMKEQNIGDMFAKTKVTSFQDFDASKLPGFGKVTRRKNPSQLVPGGAQFNPPRVSSISSLVQDPSEYAGFRLSERSSVNGIDKQGKSYNSTGVWTFSVGQDKAGISYTANEYDMTSDQSDDDSQASSQKVYDNVVVWEINATGFQNAPIGDFMGHPKMVVYYNVKPIVIPRIEIETKLVDLLPPDKQSFATKFANILFSKVVVSLDIIKELPL